MIYQTQKSFLLRGVIFEMKMKSSFLRELFGGDDGASGTPALGKFLDLSDPKVTVLEDSHQRRINAQEEMPEKPKTTSSLV